jgi:hypothetical protein
MGHWDDRTEGPEYRVELFVFPDGLSVELMVFDEPADRASRGSSTHGRAGRAPEPQAPPALSPTDASQPFAGGAAAHTRNAQDTTPCVARGVEARRCPVCGGELVYPLDWRRTSKTSWTLRLRCPDCETMRDVLMERPDVEELNRHLYRAHQAVAEESRNLARRNFEEEAERFVAALASGLIQPIDF